MRILVTGGAGFIGSHVARAYHQAGHEVLALDSLLRGNKENLGKGIELAEVDIRDREAVARVFADFKPEMVNHHAAQVSVRDSVDDPLFDADVNVIGSLMLLEACQKQGTARFIFASTGGAIYGEQDSFPASEDHPEKPVSPYAVAKLAVEKYLFFYEKTYGMRWASLRYANVYGPRQDPFGEAGVVAIFSQKMLGNKAPFINGDGEQTRDYVYVSDVARSNLLALEKEATGCFNIGTGVETSVNQVFRALRELSGSHVEERHGPPKKGEQRRSVLDPGLAKRALGWNPETPLKQGLQETIDFFRNSYYL